MSRIVAIDPGTKRIGIAISDSARTMAFPRSSISAGDDAIEELARLIVDEGVELVLVGRPVSLAGRETASTAMADEFRLALGITLDGVDVVAVDERLTSVTAKQRLSSAGVRTHNQRNAIDSAAATVLLQSYLDANIH